MTRSSDKTVSLDERAAMANEKEVDLLVSVHVNAIPPRAKPRVETYYYRPRRRHRRGRSYSFEQWHARINTADKSQILAGHVQEAVLAQVRRGNPEIRDLGVRRREFQVLRDVTMPGILAELTVLSVHEEEARLRTDVYRDQLARALESGVLAYLEQEEADTLKDYNYVFDRDREAHDHKALTTVEGAPPRRA